MVISVISESEVAAVWTLLSIDVIVMMDLILHWFCLNKSSQGSFRLTPSAYETNLFMKLYCSLCVCVHMCMFLIEVNIYQQFSKTLSFDFHDSPVALYNYRLLGTCSQCRGSPSLLNNHMMTCLFISPFGISEEVKDSNRVLESRIKKSQFWSYWQWLWTSSLVLSNCEPWFFSDVKWR